MRLRLHPRHRIDASWGDAVWALLSSLRAPAADPDVYLSVRSAFHLLLETAGWAPGDEVLMSAVTHPDMVRIVELHGLRPIPVDVDFDTLAPDERALEAALAAAPRARALVVAHLFGAWVELDAALAAARRHGLVLIEDCAQSLSSAEDRGDPRADVSLFSFGFLKTATAFGGALAVVRDPDLAAGMAKRHAQWPLQTRSAYAGRAARALLALALSRPVAYGLAVRLLGDPGPLVRSTPPADDDGFRAWLERRPSGGLVATLGRRLARFPAERLRRRAEAGDELAAAAAAAGLERPGWAVGSTHWLFPVVVADPDALVDRLWAAGFDAARGTSQIAAVEPAPPTARRMMAGIVFVPAYPEVAVGERRRLASLL
ncbi:MAG: aminotransferase class I/II-fold pyridoxal phosphate-dependent enzyme [Acidimicrobiia bacterium]